MEWDWRGQARQVLDPSLFNTYSVVAVDESDNESAEASVVGDNR